MEKFNKFLSFLGFVGMIILTLLAFNSSYNFIGFLDGYKITADALFYCLTSFVFVFTFFTIFKKKAVNIIIVVLLTLAFILTIIMCAAPELILKIIPAK